MFERFTDRARSVIGYTSIEAEQRGDFGIGTLHLLLALARDSDSLSAKVLVSYGASLDALRRKAQELSIPVIPRFERGGAAYLSFSPRVKRVLELSLREALTSNHSYIGTENILQGLLREYLRDTDEQPSWAIRVLQELGIDIDELYKSARRVEFDNDYAAAINRSAVSLPVEVWNVIHGAVTDLVSIPSDTPEYYRALGDALSRHADSIERASSIVR